MAQELGSRGRCRHMSTLAACFSTVVAALAAPSVDGQGGQGPPPGSLLLSRADESELWHWLSLQDAQGCMPKLSLLPATSWQARDRISQGLRCCRHWSSI